MAKGSQRSQLKSALSQAGIAKPQQNGKKRKRTPLDEKEKERKAARLQFMTDVSREAPMSRAVLDFLPAHSSMAPLPSPPLQPLPSVMGARPKE